jgi:hypothetical protein
MDPNILRVVATQSWQASALRTSPCRPAAVMPSACSSATAPSNTALRLPVITTEQPCNPAGTAQVNLM